MYLWSICCAANQAALQPRALYSFFVPSQVSLPFHAELEHSIWLPYLPATGARRSALPRDAALGDSAASGELRPLSSTRYSRARASAASGALAAAGSALRRFPRRAGAPGGYLLPAPHPETNFTPVPPGQVRKHQGMRGVLRPRKRGFLQTLACRVLPLPSPLPPGSSPPTPGPAWV